MRGVTLILTTLDDDAVVLAADSRVAFIDRANGAMSGVGTDQKLFVRARVASLHTVAPVFEEFLT